MNTPPISRLAEVICFIILLTGALHADTVKDREGAVRDDKKKMESQAVWLYNDIQNGFAEAQRTSKPLLVVLRCVPCLSCAGIDGAVMEAPELKGLLDQFVSVRVINANDLDLGKFQFDYDLSFSAMVFNGDGTVYGRFGSWSHQKDPGEKSIAGFKATLEAALLLHGGYPSNRANLEGKQPLATPYQTPLDIPQIANHQNAYTPELNWEGKVVGSCVHCHQIGDGLKAVHRDRGELIPLKLIYPMPAPETVGLSLATDRPTRVTEVVPGSAAAAAGFRAGDDLVAANGQWLISSADLAWALHNAGDVDKLDFTVNRSGTTGELTVELAEGWRMKNDISRRVGTWPMRAMVGGGIKLEDLPDDERRRLKIDSGALALKAIHVGQYGKHAAAKRAGFEIDDIIVELDGITERLTESEYFGTLLTRHPRPATLNATVLRKGKRIDLKFPMQ